MTAPLRLALGLALFASFGAVACSAPVDDPEGDSAQAQTTGTSSSALGFLCQCKAIGPGYETSTTDKFCQYSCACDTLTKDGMEKAPSFTTDALRTSAKSYEHWDFGSHICHGQYAFRPTLSSPNWEIQVKFSAFRISHLGYVSYDDPSVETSTNVSEELKRSEEAPEIRDAIAKKLHVTL